MAAVTCPRCGFVQEGAIECARCGVVFARAHASEPAPPRAGAAGRPALRATRATVPEQPQRKSQPAPEERPQRSWLGRAYRALRWVTLSVLLTALLLILYTKAAPEVQKEPGAGARAETKLAQMVVSSAQGALQSLELDEPELNGWLQDRFSQAKAAESAATGDAQVEQMRSNVRDIRVQLVDDYVRAWVLFHVYGKDLTLTLEARPSVRDGLLHLEPLGGWLGSLPIPATALERGFARGLAHPANADKLRLPPYVAGIRVEGGRLIIAPSAAAVGRPQFYVPGARPAAPEGVGAPGEPDPAPEQAPAPSQQEE